MKRLTFLAGLAALLSAGTALAEPVNLTLWHMEQPPHRVQRMQELLDEFNKANPDIVVKQEPQSWGEVYAKAPAAMSAGNGPDLLFTIPDFTTVMKGIDAVVPVDDLVKELDAKHGFVPATLAPYQYDDHVWAVPAYNMAISLWYRNSALKAAGIEVPKTWSEWKAAAEKLSADGKYGIGLPANKQLYTDQTVYSFMVNNGAADIYKDDGSIDFDKPQTVGGLPGLCRPAEAVAAGQPVMDLGRGRGLLRQRQLRHDPAVHRHQHLRHAGGGRSGGPWRGTGAACRRPGGIRPPSPIPTPSC